MDKASGQNNEYNAKLNTLFIWLKSITVCCIYTIIDKAGIVLNSERWLIFEDRVRVYFSIGELG